MIKRILAAMVVGLSLVIGAGSAWAADFKKGVKAAQRGDFATALRELRPLAEQGNASAQNNLGVMYANGQGVTEDYKEAARWYRLAAEQGYGDAQNNLGVAYATGEGVTQDYAMAHMWFNITVSNGVEHGAENRDRVANMMTTVQLAEAQKLARECVARSYKGCWASD